MNRTRTFNCKINWNSEYIPFIEGWELTENANESVSSQEIKTRLNEWLESVKGEEHCIEMYSFQAICDEFNKAFARKLIHVQLGEGLVAVWSLNATPSAPHIVDGEEFFHVDFVATELN